MNDNSPNNRFEQFRYGFENKHKSDTNDHFCFTSAISTELESKSEMIEAVRSLNDSQADLFSLGTNIQKEVHKTFGSIGQYPRQKLSRLHQHFPDYYTDYFVMIGRVLRSTDDEVTVFKSTYDSIMEFHYRTKDETRLRGTLLHLLMVTLACKENSKTIFGMVRFFENVTKFFTGKKLFGFHDKNINHSFGVLSDLVTELHDRMRDDWNWEVNTRLDVQSALWMEFHNPK